MLLAGDCVSQMWQESMGGKLLVRELAVDDIDRSLLARYYWVTVESASSDEGL